MAFLTKLLNYLTYLFYGDLMPNPIMNEPAIEPKIEPTKRELLIREAVLSEGVDITPDDLVSDDVACAQQLSTLIKRIFPDFPIIPSTEELARVLSKDPRFENTVLDNDPSNDLDAGNIIVSPTPRGNGSIRGHCGLFLDNHLIMSNNSATGKWEQNYDINSWIRRYRKIGGFPILIFSIK